jgi:hypothetical protein
MMFRSASCLMVLLAALVTGRTLAAQSPAPRWVIDPTSSLVWWQMTPHLGHLWATTCPDDPSWQAGEGRTIESIGHIMRIKTAYAAHDDSRIPLYPRKEVQAVCAPSVTGELEARDTTRWDGARAHVTVRPQHLITGQRIRDDFARNRIFEVEKFPEIRFEVDSIVAVTPGDTTTAKAVGTFELRGVRTPMVVPVTVSRDANALRVRGHFEMPADDLIKRYKVSQWALGLSVGQRIWRTLHMGFDLVLRRGA